jgi:putative ABC transport system permease protein
MEYRLPRNKYQTSDAQTNFHRQLAARVGRVPGVVSAAIVQTLPFSGNWSQVTFNLPGQPTAAADTGLLAFYNIVTPEYFSTVGIPLLRGRLFTEHDDAQGAPSAIISQSFAQKYFPNQDPIGREVRIRDEEQLAINQGNGATKRAIVVGVVGSAKQRFVREELQPQIYFTYAQVPGIFATLVVRTGMEPMSMSEAVRQAVWSVDKDQPVWRVRSVDYLIQHDTAPDRFLMLLMSALGLLALVLSALGTYGMLSNAVSQRTRELGVRMALGATSGSVLKLVLMQGLKLIGIGGALGLMGSFGATRLISKLLYGVAPNDVATFALGATAMIVVGLLASLVPARRATKVDPIVALRYE